MLSLDLDIWVLHGESWEQNTSSPRWHQKPNEKLKWVALGTNQICGNSVYTNTKPITNSSFCRDLILKIFILKDISVSLMFPNVYHELQNLPPTWYLAISRLKFHQGCCQSSRLWQILTIEYHKEQGVSNISQVWIAHYQKS